MLRTPQIHVGKVRGITPPMRRALARRLRAAAHRLGVSVDELAALGVRIVDDTEIARLHVAYMGVEGPTDVLSFPTANGEGLGDIAVSWPAVLRQAPVRTAAGWVDEATRLVVHGLCHLLGHDHARAAEGRAMHRVERRVLRALRVRDVPRPYAVRR